MLDIYIPFVFASVRVFSNTNSGCKYFGCKGTIFNWKGEIEDKWADLRIGDL